MFPMANCIPFGKQPHTDGKSPCFMGKSTISMAKWQFSIANNVSLSEGTCFRHNLFSINHPSSDLAWSNCALGRPRDARRRARSAWSHVISSQDFFCLKWYDWYDMNWYYMIWSHVVVVMSPKLETWGQRDNHVNHNPPTPGNTPCPTKKKR